MLGNWGSDENYSAQHNGWSVIVVESQSPTIDHDRKTFTIPEAIGLEYLVDETPAGSGTYTARGPLTICVQALTGYRLPADCETTSWQLNA